MEDIPDTVTEAVAGVRTASRPALEAGAGAGNATAALRAGDARPVCAVTDDREHATGIRERFPDDECVQALQADLRAIPLPEDAVEVVTAHALFNVVPTTDAGAIVEELTRVTAPGGTVVVDDYGPIPDRETRALFGAGNAVAELVERAPTYTFYPASHLRRLFEAEGWTHVETTTLLDPVPWTTDLLDAHAEIASERTEAVPDPLATALRDHIEHLRAALGERSDTGRMYSVRLDLPE
jgi:SAM-dependent methyltransferase